MVSFTQKISNALHHQGLRGLTGRINKRLGIIGAPGAATGRTCLRPFYFAGIGSGGEVYCCDASWGKFRLGKLGPRTGMAEIWNGRIARQYRAAMCRTDPGQVCNLDVCPYSIDSRLPVLENGVLGLDGDARLMYPASIVTDSEVLDAVATGREMLGYLPKHIEMAVDSRCNLFCRSCRREKIISLPAHEQRIVDLAYRAVKECGSGLKMLSLLGSGEVLYSPAAVSFLQNLNRDVFPELDVDMITNGQLFNGKNWDRIGTGREFVSSVTISIDAASKQTYEYIRRGGSWERLLENLAFIRHLRETGALDEFSICFLVSVYNYREMPDFVRLGNRFGVDHMIFTALQPWSSMSYDFRQADISVHSHPHNDDFKRILNDPVLHRDNVVLGFKPGTVERTVDT